ncbi:NEW3 domain-containing protein [Saccharomonospora cyanea]|uniref:NEW3 domain-containing protein n=1 Tax=Saccharomonospora cyanea TaxID=40989 RepID=UPI0003079A1F|nr:NEW3 domain-containing protein [Saccharomonospora cyanea]
MRRRTPSVLAGALAAGVALTLIVGATPATAAPVTTAATETATTEDADAPAAVTVGAIDLDGPRISPVTVTVENTGTTKLQRLEVSLRGPLGWSVYPATVEVPGSLKPGQETTTTFDVRVPEPTDDFRLRTFTATATYRAQGTTGEVTGSRTQHTGTAYPSLAEAYDNVGVTDDANPTVGDFDGGGNSYSAQALAEAGVEPGTALSAFGASLTWPDVPVGTPNNVAGGRTIAVDASGERLVFLGAATGFGAGTVTVTYADGAVSRLPLGFPNWCCADPNEHGAVPVIQTHYRNTPNGPANHGIAYRVYANAVPLDPTRTVAYVTLPSSTHLHVFDFAVVS